jgi:hypothetical protein
MQIARWAGLVGSLALICPLLGPSAALAAAPCDPATEPFVAFQGLPDELVIGRQHLFRLNNADHVGYPKTYVETAAVTMTDVFGNPFWSAQVGVGNYDEGEALYIQADNGDQQLTVTATYDEATKATSYPIRPDSVCTRTISKTMPPTFGQTYPTGKIRAGYESVDFRLEHPEGCKKFYELVPAKLRVKPLKARRWTTTIKTDDQCDGWPDDGNGPSYELVSDGQTMTFEPRTRARNGVKWFRYQLTAADGSFQSGRIRVTTTHYSMRRIYGFHPDGSLNDEYWNTCVNEGRTVWMHNGNPYCIESGATFRAVKLRRDR